MFDPTMSDVNPGSADPDVLTPAEAAGHPRRGFLRGLVGGLAAVPAILSASSETATAGRPNPHARFLPALYPNWNKREFLTIQYDEDAHVDFLNAALGANARPFPTFQNLEMPDVFAFATLSRIFENTGVGAYLGALPYINSPEYLSAAASIMSIEARHAAYVNVLLNQVMTYNVFGDTPPLDVSLTIAQIVKGVSPFVVSLNGGPPLTFSTTPSAMNDIAILNFALALEFLEAEFYNINVPKFFG